MTQKNVRLIVIVVTLLLLVGGGTYAAYQMVGKSFGAPSPSPQAQKKKINDPVNVIAVDERPYVQITPDASGKRVYLVVGEVKKSASAMDYELEYQAGELLQGAFGTMDVSKVPVTKDLLLGSCSAGGACTYHTNVKGGSLLMRFTGGESYAVKSDWKFIENTAKEKQISSKDAKFQMDGAALATQRYLVVYNTPGFPGKPPGTVISDSYALASAGEMKGQAKLTIRATEEDPKAVIAGWDGTAWKEFASTSEGKAVSATVDFLKAYAVVRK